MNNQKGNILKNIIFFSAPFLFLVSVAAADFNMPPGLNYISDMKLRVNAGPQKIILTGISSGNYNEAQPLTVTATSSSSQLIQNLAVDYRSPSAMGVLTFSPAPNLTGTATITVMVSDGDKNIGRSFRVNISQNPTANVPPLSTTTLFNGIVIPYSYDPALQNGMVSLDPNFPNSSWPPHPTQFPFYSDSINNHNWTTPYLANPPAVQPINVGRQLFVDDFLIDTTTLIQTYHQAQPYSGNPVLSYIPSLLPPYSPEGPTPLAHAIPFSGGIWLDPDDGVFKMWYSGNFYFEENMHWATFMATSTDGIHWIKPDLGVVTGTNMTDCPIPCNAQSVWLDKNEQDHSKRWKMLAYHYSEDPDTNYYQHIYSSGDGIHWEHEAANGFMQDRSTMFYNPFRNKWALSIRLFCGGDFANTSQCAGHERDYERFRHYFETNTITLQGFNLTQTQVNQGTVTSRWFWNDMEDYEQGNAVTDSLGISHDLAQLYNLDVMPYENLFVGFYATKARNADSAPGRPKLNFVSLGFSRDGFYFSRPLRSAFFEFGSNPTDWNYGNVQSANGYLVMGDSIYFYYSGRQGGANTMGVPGVNTNQTIDSRSSTGLAILRRDGFASMDAGVSEGTLTTRPVTFTGRHLFVNVKNPAGSLRVEVSNQAGTQILASSNSVSVDSTKQIITWQNGLSDLSSFIGTPVRFKFYLRGGELYSFWVSPTINGESNGYLMSEMNAPSQVAAPVASLPGGTYAGSQTVSLSTTTIGASIRYTLDGSNPVASSSLYSAPLIISQTTTLKARAFKSGISDSDALTVNYIIGSNTAPTISTISDQTIAEDSSITVNFTINDTETPSSLALSKISSNESLVPLNNIVFSGSGSARTATLTPAANEFGNADIMITVSDGPLSASRIFRLTVNPVNDAPAISNIPDQTLGSNTPSTAIAFSVSDPDNDTLNVTATSNNQAVVANGGLALSGSGSNRALTITPVTNATGSAVITVIVSDGNLSAQDVLNVTVQAAVAPSPSVGLIGWWKMDEISGLTATDSSGVIPSHPGVWGGQGGIYDNPRWVAGRTGNAIKLDGVNDFINVGAFTMPASYTKAAWVKPMAIYIQPDVTVHNILSGDVTSAASHSFYAEGPARGPVTLKAGNEPRWPAVVDPTGALQLDQWYHVTVTFDAPGGVMKLYKDGNLVATASGVPVNQDNYLSIGNWGSQVGTDHGYRWNGQLDDVRLYNRALLDTEILALAAGTPPPPMAATPTASPAAGQYATPQSVTLSTSTPGATIRYTLDGSEPTASSTVYSAPVAIAATTTIKAKSFLASMADSNTLTATYIIGAVPPPSNGLVAEWTFDAVSGTTVNDTSGNNNHGTLVGGASLVAGPPGKGQAVNFDGADDRMNVSSSASLNVTSAATFAYWFKPAVSLNSASGRKDPISQVLKWWFVLNYPNNDGKISFVANSGSPIVKTTTNSWSAGQWYHITGTINASQMKIYVNGVLEGTATGGTMVTNAEILSLGGNRIGSPFAGQMDDLKIYNRVLSDAEIAVLANLTPDTTNPTVSISAPSNNAIVSNTISVTANASDDRSVAGVQFKLNGQNLGSEDTTAPYSISWNTRTVANGTHTLSAVARDAAGNTATAANVMVIVDNDFINPIVSITSPANNASISGAAVAVTAAASDNTGVAGVQFKIDGTNLGAEDTTFPYEATLNSATLINGPHTVTAVARDTSDNTATASINVAVNNPLAISNVQAQVGSTSATITWFTNQPTTSQVEYGLTTSYGSSTPMDANQLTNHSVTINGLAANTMYHYRVRSGALVSSDNTLTTTNDGYIPTNRVLPVKMNPDGGLITRDQSIILTCPTPGAEIRYTTDGSIPTSNSTLYIGPITLPVGDYIIKAQAFKASMTGSHVMGNWFLIPDSTAPQFYVSPTGLATNSGTEASPWDIRSVLSGAKSSEITGGATIWMKGGTYSIRHFNAIDAYGTIRLSGTANHSVILRAVPGERVIIDGYINIAASNSWLIVWGLEFLDSDSDRWYNGQVLSTYSRHDQGINVRGDNIKLINNIVRDYYTDIGVWGDAWDPMIYGTTCMNQGVFKNAAEPGGGNVGWTGATVYTQSPQNAGLKLFKDNLLIDGVGQYTMNAYSENNGVNDYNFINNIFINDEFFVGGGTGLGNTNIAVLENYIYGDYAFYGYGTRPRDNLIVLNNYFGGGLTLQSWGNALLAGNTFYQKINPFTNAAVGGETNLRILSPVGGSSTYTIQNNFYVSGTVNGENSGVSMDSVGAFYMNNFSGWTSRFDNQPGWVAYEVNTDNLPSRDKQVIMENRFEPGQRWNMAVYNWHRANSVTVNVTDVLRPGDTFLQPGDTYEIRNAFNFYGRYKVTGVYNGSSITVPMQPCTVCGTGTIGNRGDLLYDENAPGAATPDGWNRARFIGWESIDQSGRRPSGWDQRIKPNPFPQFGAFVIVKISSNPNQVAAPIASPNGGQYSAAQTVSLTSATSNSTIRYTLDGSTPNSSSTVYSTPLAISTTSTLKAYATKPGMTDSPIMTAVYMIVPAAPPAITTHPGNQTVNAGSTVTFSIAATGTAPLTYQWQKNNINISNGSNINGATASTLSITNAQGGDAGQYRCVVTNAVGNATSNNATLTVTVPPSGMTVRSFATNPVRDRSGTLLDMPWLGGQWLGTKVASDGNIYFAISSHTNGRGAGFFRFNPTTEELIVLAPDISTKCLNDPSTSTAHGKIHSEIVEHNGWLYFGTHVALETSSALANYPGGHLIGYELATGNFRDFGIVKSKHTIYAGLTVDPARNKLYVFTTPMINPIFGNGTLIPAEDNRPHLWRIDSTSGNKEDLGPMGLANQGDMSLWMYLDDNGNNWLAPVYVSSNVYRAQPGVATLNSWPVSAAQVWKWVARHPQLANKAIVYRPNGPSGSHTFSIFDPTVVTASVESGMSQTLTTIPGAYVPVVSGDRIYYTMDSANPNGNPGNGGDELRSIGLTPGVPVSHGLIIDQHGRRPMRLGGAASDNNGRLFFVGDWFANAGDSLETRNGAPWRVNGRDMTMRFTIVRLGATPNTAPTISNIADQSISENSVLANVAFTVGDAQTAAGSLTLSGASSNQTLVPNANIVFGGSGANRTVTITPAANQSGTANITVTVHDADGATASDSFTLTVNARPQNNTPPTISDIANQTINEDGATTALAFTVNDAETATGNLTVTKNSSNLSLIPLSNIVLGGSGANRTVTVTPSANQFGTATITLTVSDGSLTASDTFIVTVNSVNDAPTISNVADQIISANNSTAAIPVTINDIETAAASLTLTGSSSNTTLVLNANIVFGGNGANRTVTVTPAANQTGTATITLTVSDGSLTATDTFVLTVNALVNQPPTISNVTDRSTNEDTPTGAISFTVGDIETSVGNLTVSGTSSNAALVPNANIVFGGTGANRTVTITPAANQSGASTITLTVSDGSLTASDTFVLTVNAVNDLPTISDVANRTINANTSTAAIPFTVGDVETAAASLILTGSSSNTTLVPNANIVFGGSGASRTVTVTPAANQTGTATITLTVSDGASTATDTFTLTVNAAPPATPGLVGYWNFNEPSGTSVLDTSGLNNHGTLNAGVTRAPGRLGGGLTFNGTTGLATIPDHNSLDVTRSTFAFWFKPAQTITAASGRKDIFSKPLSYWVIANYPNNDGKLAFIFNSGTPILKSTTSTWNAGQWYHVAATYDGTTMKLYVNGVLENQAASATAPINSSSPLKFGDSEYGPAFGGMLDEIRIYNDALSAQQISALAGGAMPPPDDPVPNGLVMKLAFDEGTGAIARDLIGSNHGTLLNGASWTAGKRATALNIDGVNDELSVPDSAVLDVTRSSFSFWFKPSQTINAASGRKDMFDKQMSYWLIFNYPANDGKLAFVFNTGSPILKSTTVTWNAGQWYHVVATYEGAMMKLYINGVLENQLATTVNPINSSSALRLGISDYGPAFAGAVDELRIYNRAVTAEEAGQLYRLGQ